MDRIGETTGYDYLSRINSIIRKSIHFALADKIFIEDFTKNVEVFGKVSKQSADDKFFHSLKNYERVINYLHSKFDYKKSIVSYTEYFFKTGLRYEELIALKWEDVDFKNGYIKTYRRFNTEMYKFVKPKNDTSVRSVPINKKDLDILEQIKKLKV
jgi:integrase